MPRSASVSAQSDQCIRCPIIDSLDTIECIKGENARMRLGMNLNVHFAHCRKRLFAWCGPYAGNECPDRTAHAQSFQGLRCQIASSVDSVNYIDEQR